MKRKDGAPTTRDLQGPDRTYMALIAGAIYVLCGLFGMKESTLDRMVVAI
jgi:hypothetical protein